MSIDNVISLCSDSRLHRRLSEDEMTCSNLFPFLENAVLDYELDDDGDIYIKDGAGFPFWISIDQRGSQIAFFTFVGCETVNLDKMNEFNEVYRAVQFFFKRGRINASYYMTFKYGLDTRQFIVMARHFGEICKIALGQFVSDKAKETESATADGSS